MNKLKMKRQEVGMTQLELANLTQVTRQTIGLIEKDLYNPSIKICIAICKALGTTLDEIFWEAKE
ncbi:helix-turn-helix transcriptional regulator [Alkalicoccobacillus gibsonii]|uniref:helix-turn-helix transcriptional regulator n=1 Tax=Alkalicoccobacillus gibsonii TaxID=79881 RepID=UPI003F7C8146